jgi:alpha-glucosidase
MKIKSINKFFTLIVIVILAFSCTPKGELKISSPNKQVVLGVNVKNGKLEYQLNWNGEQLIDSSIISIFNGLSVAVVKTEIQTIDTIWHPVWGQFSEIRDHCNELVLSLEFNGKPGKLKARAYNDGIAFRIEAENTGGNKSLSFKVEHKLAGDDKLFWPAGES